MQSEIAYENLENFKLILSIVLFDEIFYLHKIK